jgi:hypothetical protein
VTIHPIEMFMNCRYLFNWQRNAHGRAKKIFHLTHSVHIFTLYLYKILRWSGIDMKHDLITRAIDSPDQAEEVILLTNDQK